MSNELTERTVKTCYIIMATSILFRGLQFLCERENSVHQRSVVLRTELQQTYLWTKFRWFASLHEGRMSPALLAQVWWLKSGSLPLLSIATDASMVRERCWLLEGRATQQIKQQIEKRHLAQWLYIRWTHLHDKKFKSNTRCSPLGGVDGWARD